MVGPDTIRRRGDCPPHAEPPASPPVRRSVRARLCCLGVAAGLLLAASAGCHQAMQEQPRIDPLEASPLSTRTASAREPVAGTIPRGRRVDQAALYQGSFATGRGPDGELLNELPASVLAGGDMRSLLERGRGRYEVFCVHCHDLIGSGNGRVPQRGYPFPPTFHSQRLRDVPLGYFYDVITNGRGRMPAHRNLIDAPDRWRIAAYVRALQFSQYAPASGLPSNIQEELREKASPEQQQADG